MSSELLNPTGQERGCELAASSLQQDARGSGRAVEVTLGHRLYWLLELRTFL